MRLLKWVRSLFAKPVVSTNQDTSDRWAVDVAKEVRRRTSPVIVVSRSIVKLRAFADLCASQGLRVYIAQASSKAFPYKIEELTELGNIICAYTPLVTTGWRHRGNFSTGAHFISLDGLLCEEEVHQILCRFLPPVPTLLWSRSSVGRIQAACRRPSTGYTEESTLFYDPADTQGNSLKSILAYAMSQSTSLT